MTEPNSPSAAERRQVELLLSQLAAAFNRRGVEYLVIGGNALKQHAPRNVDYTYLEESSTVLPEIRPFRGTRDIDIWVRPGVENALRVSEALFEFDKNQSPRLALLALKDPEGFHPVTHGPTGIEIDLLAAISGQDLIGGFDAARSNRIVRDLNGVPTPFISNHHQQINKLAAGREKDLNDARDLLAADRRESERENPPSEPEPTPPSPASSQLPDLSEREFRNVLDQLAIPVPFPDAEPSEESSLNTVWNPYAVEASMLSIQSRGGGCEKYYLSSTVEEYYLTESASSVWLGKGAHALDLSGPVQSEDFKGLLRGYSPAGSKLVQNAGADTERPAGWDLTFSMPKSAGVLWAVTDDATRTKIEAAHLSAVTAALGYLEREAAVSRTVTKVVVDNKPKRIVEHQKAELIVGAFHHGTSRLQDPQPHTHCLVMNVARRESDGRFGALYTPPVYKHKMAAGAVYQAQLANELRALGLPVEAVRNADGVPLGYFEVAGVPKEVRDHFSKRRQQIEESLRTKGHASAEAAEVAALDTRPGKRDLPPKEDLFRAWREEAAARGLTRDKAQALFGREPRYDKRDVERVKSALDAAKERLTESVSHFSERELYRETLIRTLGTGVSPEVVRQAVSTATQKSGDLVALGRHKGEQQFTTKAVWQTEKELLASTAKLDERVAKGLNPGAVEARVNEPRRGNDGSTFTLTEEQKGAVQCLTRDGGSVRVMSGGAGTGKTTVLADVRELYERAGYRVVGAAVAGVAARGLESGSGIKSDTVAMRFLEMDRRLRDTLKHHGKQLVRAALGLPTYSLDAKLTIDKKTVLVVDEAGMLGTKDLARLMKAVEAGGGRIILVGDARQLPPVQAGGGFRGVGERIGPAGRHELTEVTRQRDPRDREVGTHIARGNAREALRNLAARGKLHVGESRPEAVARLVSDWTAEGVAKPKDHVIIAVTNADVRDLNTRAQAERATAGELSGRAVQVNGYAVRVGDRVMLRERSKKLGVENGDLGTVTAVSGNKVAVVLDRGKDPVVLSTKRYRAVELGYAVTTYKSQGATFQNTYAYAGGWLTSRELGYVTATRYKEEGRFYTDKFEAGGDLTKLARGQQKDADLSRSPLARQLEQSREKVLAHDVPSEQNLKQERSQKAAAPPPPPPEPQRRR